LDKAENSVRPGNISNEIIIRWQPCVFTFHMLKKELKSGLLKNKQDRVRSWGIKAIGDFIPGATTHVVFSKRNTPKALQAIICGKYLVDESYIDAIEYAATPKSLDTDEDASPLELDFDSAWPHPKDHLPQPGKEPSTRGAETYQPGPDRSHIFQKYTFVFGEQSQYDNLLPVITTGHGKALLFKVIEHETTVEDAYQYIQNAAGNGVGDRSQVEQAGAVLVRWDNKSEAKEWTANLINQVALKMDQRAIDQSEFLDAILANDASLLKQPIPYESTTDGRVAPPPSMAPCFKSIRQPTQPRPEAATKVNGTKDTQHRPSLSQARSQVPAP
jgi:Second BRCT domain on Nijmegen syndrome breakage protein